MTTPNVDTLFQILLYLKSNKISHFDLTVLSTIVNDMKLNEQPYSSLTQVQIAQKLMAEQPNIARSIKKLKTMGYIRVDGIKTFITMPF